MARVGLAIVSSILLCTNVTAQRSGVGIKAGPLMSTLRSEVAYYDPVLGGTFGLYAPMVIGRRLEIQPEIMVASMGSAYRSFDRDPVPVRTIYVQFPVSAKLYLSRSFNLQAGIQAAKRVNAIQHGAEGTEDITDRYANFDLGGNGGLGLDLRTGWDFTVRYYHGSSAVLVGDAAIFPRNRSVQLTIGHRLVDMGGHSTRRRK